MCGIAGFYQSHFDYLTKEEYYRQILEEMDKYHDKDGSEDNLAQWQHLNVVFHTCAVQNRTDCKISQNNSASDQIHTSVPAILYAVCIKQKRNRTQNDHDKT